MTKVAMTLIQEGGLLNLPNITQVLLTRGQAIAHKLRQ